MWTEFEYRHGAAFAPVIGKPYEGKPLPDSLKERVKHP